MELTAEAFVARHFGARAAGLEPLGAGEWSRAYALTLDGSEVVLRLGKHGGDFAKDAAMGRRAPASLHVPLVLEHGPAGDDLFYAVSQRRHGAFLDHLDSADLRAVLPEVLAAMDTIATVDVAGEEAIPSGSWPELLLAIADERPRLAGWRQALESSAVGLSTFDAAYGVLGELAPTLADRSDLVHMDLLNRNVLVADGRITAIFDWGNAFLGDGVYDAAWMLWWAPWLTAFDGINVRSELTAHWSARGALPEDLDRRLLACQLHIGLDHLAFHAWAGERDHLARQESQVRELLRSTQ